MAKISEVIEGTYCAEVGLRVEGSYEWKVIGTLEMPYKIRLYMQPAPAENAQEPSSDAKDANA